MTLLQVLDLNTNCLTGGIPEDIANSSVLRKLDLGGNSLGGTIPPQLGTLPNLINLTASSNGISGEIPSSLGNLTKLQWLYLGWNSLSGELPPSLGNLQELLLLDLDNNALSGSIPPELGNLKNLTLLRLYSNKLTGEIPASLGNLSSLQALDLAMNNLQGAIPTELTKLSSLELFYLYINNLSGLFPSWLPQLPRLNDVSLYNNSLTGQIPQSLGSNNLQLQVFDVSHNLLHGSIPPFLCAGNSLYRLIMFSNQLSGPIPSGIINCPSLIRLRLQNNMLNGSLPKIITPSVSVQFMDICNNSLTGTIPAEIGNASSLQALLISQNQFDGELPMELQNLQNLEKFLASQNKFVGSLPLQVCANKPSLYDLQLDSNAFSGTIPSQIATCTGLENLNLNNNHLSGSIPEELSRLPSLGYLDLSVNDLSGVVPSVLSSSLSLVSINVSFNKLSGPFPNAGVFTNLTASDFQGNAGLCGSLQGLQPCAGNLSVNARAASNSKIGLLSYLLPSLFLMIVLLLLASIFLLYRKCNQVSHMLERQAACRNPILWSITMFQTSLVLTEEDILGATKEENLIGKGGSGKVYKGETSTGEAFVVKKLWARHSNEDSSRMGSLYDHGYRAEVETVGKIRHRNIVHLLCSCVTRDHDLLVYEYMPNGSLADVLQDKGKAGLLGWDSRYRIGVDIAQALSYLHHDCVPQILHRDIKSHNILLDATFTAHLSDFGLAKHLQGAKHPETMSVLAGSCGYIAPEYGFTLKASDKCDVYSFGVVLLELISGRKPVELGLDGQSESLVMWINNKMIQNIEEVVHVVDTRLGHLKEYVKEESFWLLKVALMCTSPSSYCRPSMREVVEMLIRPKIGETSFSSSSTTMDLKKLVDKEDLIAMNDAQNYTASDPLLD